MNECIEKCSQQSKCEKEEEEEEEEEQRKNEYRV
jgi:hypothetical protein